MLLITWNKVTGLQGNRLLKVANCQYSFLFPGLAIFVPRSNSVLAANNKNDVKNIFNECHTLKFTYLY